MIIEYILSKKADLLLDLLIILLTLVVTYWYTEERNYIFHLKALINEIEGNISELSESEFNRTLNQLITHQRNWLAKGVSIRVASGVDEGFLYQYLLDHAYTIFVTKGYILKLQNCEYVRGGDFGPLAEFYLECYHFNRESFQYEQNIVNIIGRNGLIDNSDVNIIELRQLRLNYYNRLNDRMNSESITFLKSLIWDFQGVQLVIVLIIMDLLIIIS